MQPPGARPKEAKSLSDRSVREPSSLHQWRRERRTAAELIEAIRQDEAEQGRAMTYREMEGFAKGFFGVELTAEVMVLEALGLLEDGEV